MPCSSQMSGRIEGYLQQMHGTAMEIADGIVLGQADLYFIVAMSP